MRFFLIKPLYDKEALKQRLSDHSLVKLSPSSVVSKHPVEAVKHTENAILIKGELVPTNRSPLYSYRFNDRDVYLVLGDRHSVAFIPYTRMPTTRELASGMAALEGIQGAQISLLEQIRLNTKTQSAPSLDLQSVTSQV
jgi:hypothetical protein